MSKMKQDDESFILQSQMFASSQIMIRIFSIPIRAFQATVGLIEKYPIIADHDQKKKKDYVVKCMIIAFKNKKLKEFIAQFLIFVEQFEKSLDQFIQGNEKYTISRPKFIEVIKILRQLVVFVSKQYIISENNIQIMLKILSPTPGQQNKINKSITNCQKLLKS